jgi:hypothetical protein
VLFKFALLFVLCLEFVNKFKKSNVEDEGCKLPVEVALVELFGLFVELLLGLFTLGFIEGEIKV